MYVVLVAFGLSNWNVCVKIRFILVSFFGSNRSRAINRHRPNTCRGPGLAGLRLCSFAVNLAKQKTQDVLFDRQRSPVTRKLRSPGQYRRLRHWRPHFALSSSVAVHSVVPRRDHVQQSHRHQRRAPSHDLESDFSSVLRSRC